MAKTGKGNSRGFLRLERIWAEQGVVKVQDGKDGKIVTKSVKEALTDAHSLNNMSMPPHLEKYKLSLIEKIIGVCREARQQQESPDKKTEIVTNILSGLTAEGKQKPEGTPSTLFEAKVMNYKFMYPELALHEIEAILKEGMDDNDMELLMKEMNNIRMNDRGLKIKPG